MLDRSPARARRRARGFRRGMSKREPKHTQSDRRGREQAPPDQLPRIFRDPTNPYGYPYNIHETDGLSRNPDDCVRWGCLDVNGGSL